MCADFEVVVDGPYNDGLVDGFNSVRFSTHVECGSSLRR